MDVAARAGGGVPAAVNGLHGEVLDANTTPPWIGAKILKYHAGGGKVFGGVIDPGLRVNNPEAGHAYELMTGWRAL